MEEFCPCSWNAHKIINSSWIFPAFNRFLQQCNNQLYKSIATESSCGSSLNCSIMLLTNWLNSKTFIFVNLSGTYPLQLSLSLLQWCSGSLSKWKSAILSMCKSLCCLYHYHFHVYCRPYISRKLQQSPIVTSMNIYEGDVFRLYQSYLFYLGWMFLLLSFTGKATQVEVKGFLSYTHETCFCWWVKWKVAMLSQNY